MNPYEILGVLPHATNAEIKSAYRRLVKQFHPDVNKSEDQVRIKQLNEAYDILSDPVRKAAFDGGGTTVTVEYQEDPREAYRREYINRKREEARKKKVETNRKLVKFEASMKLVYKVIWFLTFPILAFALLPVIDRYLPQVEYHEVAESGWQKRLGGNRLRPSRRGELVSFMKTKHFIIAVPDEIHVNYDYYATTKETLVISVSPIFDIPSTVSLNHNGAYRTADIEKTIFSNRFKVHYLLLLTSLFMVFRKEYSELNFCLCFLSPLFFVIVLFIMF